ncbi:MAG: hypothetical protein ACD_13C00230G0002 [uncultured bacterium]|nr:MAG: hypothetical protein ACD_13C00230G0002 [uncultured bacterium]
MEDGSVQAPTPSTNVPPVNNTSQDVPPVKLSSAKLVAFMFILIILLLGTTVFFFYQNSQLKKQVALLPTPSPIALATPDPTADWKTYLNTSAKYSIKYPPSWKVENFGLMEVKPADENTKYVRFSYQPDISKGSVEFNIEETPVLDISQDIEFDEERTFGTELAKCGTSYDGMLTFCWLKVNNQSKYLVFAVLNYKNIDDNKIVDQILSTFKFTEAANSPIPTATQQVCTLEAKICPDGSSVGRTEPNCEFAPCP